MRWLLICMAIALPGCGGAGSPEPTAPAPETASPAAAEPAGEPDYIAPPFSAEDLRAGIPVGTELRLRVQGAGAPAVIQHWVFTHSDASGCTIASRVLAEDGSLIRDEGSGTSTWAELESHAHFPAALTTRTESSVDVPAGHFETWLFEVRPAEPDGPIRRFHFARELPGPPVWMEITKGDTVITKMELLSRTGP